MPASGSVMSGHAGSSAFSHLLDSARQLSIEHGASTAMGNAAQAHPLTAADLLGPGGRYPVMTKGSGKLKPTDFTPAARQGLPGVAHPLASGNAVAHGKALPSDADIEKQAQRLVSQTFFGTLLKQMHDSPFKSEMFSGGRGGKAFEPLMDQHLADRMARGAGKKLTRSIARQLKRRAAHTQPISTSMSG